VRTRSAVSAHEKISDENHLDEQRHRQTRVPLPPDTPLAVVTGLMFAYSPVLIAGAPYESTMGLIQKIFYYHVPSWFAMFAGVFICGFASIVYLFRSRPEADRLAVSAAEVAVIFGLIGLVTGPLWARKAWGVWWQWDEI